MPAFTTAAVEEPINTSNIMTRILLNVLFSSLSLLVSPDCRGFGGCLGVAAVLAREVSELLTVANGLRVRGTLSP